MNEQEKELLLNAQMHCETCEDSRGKICLDCQNRKVGKMKDWFRQAGWKSPEECKGMVEWLINFGEESNRLLGAYQAKLKAIGEQK